jgi:glucose-1-phosphate adenylyltransferase
MQRIKTLALILAGGEGKRLGVLTQQRAKPALPFAGVYRLIDVPLSNCVHSEITDVWVIEQFEPHALNDHLTNGRPWDLDRTVGGLRLLTPHTAPDEGGFHQGNADALYRNRRLIREFNPDLLLVLSADHLYRLDYRDVIDAHLERKADVTMVTTEVPIEEASRFGVVETDDAGRVTRFAYKPDDPFGGTVTTEVFVYTADTLLRTIDELAAQEGEDALQDWGDQLLPTLVERGNAWTFTLSGYWRDVGTVASYWQAHMELLDDDLALRPDDPAWPLRTTGEQRMPARISRSATIDNSLIAPGCDIRGQVINSVIGPGVRVAENAIVDHAVVLHNAAIEAGAQVRYAIVDSAAQIGAHAVVGDRISDREQLEDRLTVIGQRAEVRANARVAAGERIEPRQA